MFPQTVGGHQFNEADFDGFGYLTALPLWFQSVAMQVAEGLFYGLTTAPVAINWGALSGTYTWTIASGAHFAAFAAGTPVLVTDIAGPTTRYFSGIVTSYSGVTGSLTVNVGSVRAGTGSGNYSLAIMLGGDLDNIFGLGFGDSATAVEPILLDRGGLGNDLGGTPSGYLTLGIGSPSNHAEEIFEDFLEAPINTGGTPFVLRTIDAAGTVVNNSQLPPFFALTMSSGGASNPLGGGGWLYFQPTDGIVPAVSASLFIGTAPFICLAPGGDVNYEVGVAFSPNVGATSQVRLGLAGKTSSQTGDVFSRCGIGFICQAGIITAVYCAYGNRLTKVIGNYSRSAVSFTRLQMDIYRAAGVIIFKINDIEQWRVCYASTQTNVVSENMTIGQPLITQITANSSISPAEAMMWPVCAIQGTTAYDYTYVDYVYVRNMLQRGTT